jgi:uncharacterized damage-inducible protein DinB
MRAKTLFLLTVFSSGAGAQGLVADVRANWRTIHNYIVQSAKDVPEDKYNWKPTPEVRSFGEQFAHVASNEIAYCAIALGQTPPAEDAVKPGTKAAMLAGLDKAALECEKAYGQTDTAAAGMTTMYGNQRSRFRALIVNATHDGEHYGNLITYLRMNKIVPPSSR